MTLFAGLRPHGDHELLGWFEVDPAVRRPADNGARDVEILISMARVRDRDAYIEACAGRVRQALANLPAIIDHVVTHLPPSLAGVPDMRERLFLEGFEFEDDGRLTVAFDYEELDMVVVLLDDEGNGGGVVRRP